MKFFEKYKHVGYSYPAVPKGWVSIVEKAIVLIEKEMWPRWMPFFLKRLIHWLATGNSVVFVKYWWAYRLRQRITKGQMITDIKEKYATMRIYGYFDKEIDSIIASAENECSNTCQECGSTNHVQIIQAGWLYNLCESCSRSIHE